MPVQPRWKIQPLSISCISNIPHWCTIPPASPNTSLIMPCNALAKKRKTCENMGGKMLQKPSWLNAYGNLLIQGHCNGNSPITFDFRALAAAFPCPIECRSILALSHLLTPVIHLCLQPPLVVKGSARANFFLPSSLRFSTHQLLIALGKHPFFSCRAEYFTGSSVEDLGSLDPTPNPLHGDGRESTQLRSLIPTNAMLPGRRIHPSSPTWPHNKPHHLVDLPRNSTPAF